MRIIFPLPFTLPCGQRGKKVCDEMNYTRGLHVRVIMDLGIFHKSVAYNPAPSSIIGGPSNY
jgi:hypothetical protein